MHLDLSNFEPTEPLFSRFCIIGGGIAGLLTAQRLAQLGAEVTILEAGGLELETQSQELYQAEMARAIHQGTLEGRFRSFGGSSIRWGGQLLPFTHDVFSPESGSLCSSWPITSGEISGLYDTVQQKLHVGTLPFTASLLKSLRHPAVDFSPQIRLRFSKWIPFKERNLGNTIGRECIAHPRIRLFTHANVASLSGSQEAGAEGRIDSARVLSYSRREFVFRADHFIVSAGTVESSRLLLSSPGVPNEHDQIGRYFHDHVAVRAANLPPAARASVFRRLGPFVSGGILHTCKMEAAPELQRKSGGLSVMAHIVVEEPEDTGIAAVRNILKSLQTGNLREAIGKNARPLIQGAGDVCRLVWASQLQGRRVSSKNAIVGMNIEMGQPPDPENRIRLSSNLDALGLRKAIVDWSIGEAEHQTASGFARALKQELEKAGFPAVEWMPGLLEGSRLSICDTYHPMGGLRMGTNRCTSVVDSDLKVHGLRNLHVASCAVYPSGGSSNPTFTLAALSLRLADHLITLS